MQSHVQFLRKTIFLLHCEKMFEKKNPPLCHWLMWFLFPLIHWGRREKGVSTQFTNKNCMKVKIINCPFHLLIPKMLSRHTDHILKSIDKINEYIEKRRSVNFCLWLSKHTCERLEIYRKCFNFWFLNTVIAIYCNGYS